jgi:hypothetical protein
MYPDLERLSCDNSYGLGEGDIASLVSVETVSSALSLAATRDRTKDKKASLLYNPRVVVGNVPLDAGLGRWMPLPRGFEGGLILLGIVRTKGRRPLGTERQ